jgi:murein DD-endopeptidase MepM/ murein hydrolase activator NlpD
MAFVFGGVNMSAERNAYPYSRSILLCVLLVLLNACKSTTHLAPIEQMDQPPGIKLNYHTVSRSDTMYSIAWRYGMDYRQLASLNNITPPYTIHVGQKINLTNDASASVRSSAYTASTGVEVVAIPDDANTVTEVTAVSSSETGLAKSSEPVAKPKKTVAERPVEQNAAVMPSGQWPLVVANPWSHHFALFIDRSLCEKASILKENPATRLWRRNQAVLSMPVVVSPGMASW